MKRSRLLWKIYLYFLVATVAVLALVTGNAVHTLRRFHEEQVSKELLTRARLVAGAVLSVSPSPDGVQADQICKEIGPLASTRMTVVLPSGTVIGDSAENPARMDNHADRPEIADALRGEAGKSTRYSDTLRRKLKYAAVPVQLDGTIVAVVRMSQPLADIRWTQHLIFRHLLIAGLLAVALFAIAGLYLSRRIVRPLEEIRRTAQRLAEGDLNARAVAVSRDEIGALAATLNEMAVQLGDRMETIATQQAERDAMLGCMAEGVLAVDLDGRILYLNDAACALLELAPEQAHGRSIREAVRHADIQEFVLATLDNTDASETEVVVPGVDERHVQLHGTPLRGPAGRHIGGLVVANDITRMKRLERVRSDFVANVSHELKTPITAIKGCAETLSGDTQPDPKEAARFMEMMSRHVHRLEAVVEDLLSLSRLEFDAGRGQIQRDVSGIKDVLERVINTFTKRAKAKSIPLNMDCPDGLNAPINIALLEQAIGNLLDNAIKYSGEDASVSMAAKQDGNQIVITVVDQGPGIEQKHLPRIFERFYRVDTARSRSLGGTGLGLAIVKHIALAHQGSVSVDSALGQGTTFTLHLPQG